MIPLKRLFRLVNGSTPESGRPEYWDGDVLWATPEDIGDLAGRTLTTSRRTLTQAGYASCATTLVPTGSLVLTTRAPIGNLAMAGAPLCTNQGCKGLVPRSGVHSPFYYYVLLAQTRRLQSLGQGSTFLELSTDRLGTIRVPSLSQGEQRAIADFLDRKTAAIDALVEGKAKLLALLAEKRRALLAAVVTGGLDASATLRASGIEWAGGIPRHWRVLPIKRLTDPASRLFTDGDWIESPYVTDFGVRLIQTGNVGVGVFKEQGFRFVSDETFAALRCTEVLPRDVLICRLDGPVGRACLAPDLGVRMITSVDNAILRPATDHDPRFIVHVLSLPAYLDWVQGLCRVGGGFRFRISRSMLGDFRIPVPPKAEQTAIADQIDRLLTPIQEAEARLEASQVQLGEYRQALITAAVTGQLDVSKDAA